MCFFIFKLSLVIFAVIGKEAKESAEYRTILSELQVIDVKLFEEGDELVQSRVRKVLEQLGVKNLYPADIIRHHITPVFVNSSYNVSTAFIMYSYNVAWFAVLVVFTVNV